jgi:hypothetical protein
MELIKKFCDSLSITDQTKIIYLITRISDDKKLDNKELDNKRIDNKKVDNKKINNKKLEQVNIIFDYNLLTIKCQPRVIVYSIAVKGSDLIIKPLFNPNIKQFVYRTMDIYNKINFENNRYFLIRPDTRAETRRQRRAMLPVVSPSF